MSPRALAVVALALFLTACRQSDSQSTIDLRHNRTGKGTPVATFGTDSITAEELTDRFAQMSPPARARYQTLEQKREYVEGLARFELLAAEARRQGLQNDPDVIETAKKVMVQRLLQKELDERAIVVTDAQVEEYYRKHVADYVQPATVRLFQLFLAAPAKDSARRAAQRHKLEELQKKVAALAPLDFGAFGALARQYSEEPRTQPLDGDMRYLTSDELASQYGREVAAAAEALHAPGEVSTIVETAAGFHLLKLQARRDARNATLATEGLRAQIEARIRQDARAAAYERLIAQAREHAHYRIDDARLAKVVVDVQAPTQPPSSVVPGFLPGPPPAGPPSDSRGVVGSPRP